MSIDSIADSLKGTEIDDIEHVKLSSSDWQVVNDSVMGGLSLGNTKTIENNIVFSGDISIENNGGFSSVYRPVLSLSKQFDTISLQIVGDGNLYQLRVRSQVDGYNLAYKLDFHTKINIEQHLLFRLSDFQASFRGRIIVGAPELKAEKITHVGFLIANKRPIQFSLKVKAVTFYLSTVPNE